MTMMMMIMMIQMIMTMVMMISFRAPTSRGFDMRTSSMRSRIRAKERILVTRPHPHHTHHPITMAKGKSASSGKRVKKGELWSGSPAKLMRPLTPEEVAFFGTSARHYAEMAAEYRAAQ